MPSIICMLMTEMLSCGHVNVKANDGENDELDDVSDADDDTDYDNP